jgi:hypothetical protein
LRVYPGMKCVSCGGVRYNLGSVVFRARSFFPGARLVLSPALNPVRAGAQALYTQ